MKAKLFQKFPFLYHLLLMLAVSVILVIVAFILIKVYARQGKEFEMPMLEGQTYAELSADNPLDLRYVLVDSVYQEGSEGGVVLIQDPEAGSKIKTGRKVYITVSRYLEEDAVIPEVTGVPLRQAVSMLANEGLQVGSLKFVEGNYSNITSRIPPTVHSMTYKGKEVYGGQPLMRGVKVDLVVEKDQPDATTVVPFLLGKNAAKARRTAVVALLNISEHYKSNVKDRSNAVVYRQEPEYTGVNRYEYGTKVNVWYCNPSEVDVEKMIREFKVDSSLIEQKDLPTDQSAEDFILENEGWTW